MISFFSRILKQKNKEIEELKEDRDWYKESLLSQQESYSFYTNVLIALLDYHELKFTNNREYKYCRRTRSVKSEIVTVIVKKSKKDLEEESKVNKCEAEIVKKWLAFKESTKK